MSSNGKKIILQKKKKKFSNEHTPGSVLELPLYNNNVDG